MNWEQLKAILWLRWRLSVNQWRKGGQVNFVLMIILVGALSLIAVSSYFIAYGLGVYLLPKASPTVVMIVWDVMVGLLLVGWFTSLMIEIQRTEMLSLDKLLHLPTSLSGAFLLNYLSSLVCLSIACFLPAALGLSVALAYVHGAHMLLLVPMVLSFLLMLTAVTYQLRGWLASLMSDKRSQRRVITYVTLAFVALAQLPNIVMQMTIPRSSRARSEHANELNRKLKEISADQTRQLEALTAVLNRREITVEDYRQKSTELLESFRKQMNEATQRQPANVAPRSSILLQYLLVGNLVLPVGWLPYASRQLIAGPVWPAILCGLGMTLIGFASLWRAYSSTMKYYTGNVKSSPVRARSTAVAAKEHGADLSQESSLSPATERFLEHRLPGLSEHASAVAMCSFRNLLRAPETKMMLIGPMVIGCMFAVMLFSGRAPRVPVGMEPLVWLAAPGMLTFVSMTLVVNIFGMDRGGFRCFVLMPIERSQILIGKNVALIPIVGLFTMIVAAATFYVAPPGPLDALASGCQAVLALMAASLVGNWVSIQFPMVITPGSGRPVQMNLATALVHMLTIFLSPLALAPACVFIGVERLFISLFEMPILPIYAVLSLMELWGVIQLYKYVVRRQGRMLQERETQILEALTSNAE